MEEQQHLQTENDEIFKTFTAAIKTAAEMTHCYNLFQSKNKKIDEVLCMDNKEILWQTLQDYLKEYGSFINNTTVITGIYIYQVSIEQYNDIEINGEQLNFFKKQIEHFLDTKEIEWLLERFKNLSQSAKNEFIKILKEELR